jgi:hypothetical protein
MEEGEGQVESWLTRLRRGDCNRGEEAERKGQEKGGMEGRGVGKRKEGGEGEEGKSSCL